jgi:hypothetical protein
MNFFNIKLLLGICVVLLPSAARADLYMRGGDSTITIGQGAVLALAMPINDFNGTLAPAGNSSIVGQPINFYQGSLECNGQSSVFNGSLTETTSCACGCSHIICLMGNQSLVGNGISIPSGIAVRNNNNRVEGLFTLGGSIILQDACSTLTCALNQPLQQDIVLNGGAVRLENDLSFADGYFFQGPGVVDINGKRLFLGAQELTLNTPLIFEDACDITLGNNLVLTQTWTFQGDCLINGNGNVIALQGAGEIVVDSGATLVINDVNFACVKGYNIRCVDNSSTLVLTGGSLDLESDYSFTVGSLLISGDCLIKGDGNDVTFAYQSAMTMTLNMEASLLIDYGVTFSFDSGQNNFYNAGCGAQFILNGATLHVTGEGLNLTGGILVLGENSQLYIEDTTDPATGSIINYGLALGADNVDLDCAVRFLPGATFELLHGMLWYKNVNAYSWHMPTVNSMMQLDVGTMLKLDQPLNLDKGCLRMSSQAGLRQNNGSMVTGFMDCF